MRILAVALLFVTACSQGVAAPIVTETETVCSDVFCIDVPVGWQAEVGDTYVSLSHISDPENTFLTAGLVDMEAIVTASGGSWPVPTQEVVMAFWSLIEDAGVGSFTRSQRMVGGAVRSWGEHETGTMWHLLYPLEGSSAIAIEMRAPNGSWEAHADVVFRGVSVR
ncbi:MAG: hypothetical protein BMS9Abin17_0872 [Acidimicrobiia bacterium]|nr:MAG: hypothetical protein BMS9Abin17_0872 [Acidimicrobiia bacterium]